MSLKTMDPDIIRDLIKGEKDIITPVAKMEAELLKYSHCPACGHQGADKVVMPPKFVQGADGSLEIVRTPFSPTGTTIQGHARCPACQTEYSPMTGVIIQANAPILTGVHEITDEQG